MPTVNCPACEESLDLDETYRDWTTCCPHCQHQFVPRRGGDLIDDEPDEEEYDDNYVYGREERDRRRALEAVKIPAIFAEILGWGGVILTVLCGLLILVLGMAVGNQGNNDGLILLVLAGLMCVFGLPCSLVIAWGGRHMRNLTSYGWALAAGIMSIVFGLILCGLACVVGLLHIPLGVWMLVVVNQPVVSRACRFAHRQRSQTWTDAKCEANCPRTSHRNEIGAHYPILRRARRVPQREDHADRQQARPPTARKSRRETSAARGRLKHRRHEQEREHRQPDQYCPQRTPSGTPADRPPAQWRFPPASSTGRRETAAANSTAATSITPSGTSVKAVNTPRQPNPTADPFALVALCSPAHSTTSRTPSSDAFTFDGVLHRVPPTRRTFAAAGTAAIRAACRLRLAASAASSFARNPVRAGSPSGFHVPITTPSAAANFASPAGRPAPPMRAAGVCGFQVGHEREHDRQHEGDHEQQRQRRCQPRGLHALVRRPDRGRHFRAVRVRFRGQFLLKVRQRQLLGEQPVFSTGIAWPRAGPTRCRWSRGECLQL